MIIADPTISQQNSFIGSATQQASSVTTITDPNAYELNGGGYSIYGFEVRIVFLIHISTARSTEFGQYKPGFDNGVGIISFRFSCELDSVEL